MFRFFPVATSMQIYANLLTGKSMHLFVFLGDVASAYHPEPIDQPAHFHARRTGRHLMKRSRFGEKRLDATSYELSTTPQFNANDLFGRRRRRSKG
ncbi:hypothetical protein CEXT_550691 [Caerostris extrusa]|uniref:Uncharacterized protein n=1 Tax=Caerostris extrusa TaxID=172846 RepID=A0AAV4YF40_CAEEX|nr:hypothetical protein CEXT_550691 [Caerostris extrusa]